MKKRLSLLTTRTKTVEKGMPDEYTAGKHALEREKKTLEQALELMNNSHGSWKHIGHTYKKFAELVSSDAGVDSTVYPEAGETAKAADAVHHKLEAAPDSSQAPARLIAHVKAYLAEINTIEKECVDVEKRWVEKHRYENKASKKKGRFDKFERKGKTDKAEKEKDDLIRQENKLANESAPFQTKLTGVLEMMKSTNGKFDQVLHCAHAAYWLEQHEILTFISDKTASTRNNSLAHQDKLVNYDLGAKDLGAKTKTIS